MKSLFPKIIAAMCFGLLTLPSLAEDTIPLITMDKVPVSDAIRNLARQAEINYILDPHVPADSNLPVVTNAWRNITAKDALFKVLNGRNLVMVENPVTSVARIVPKGVSVQSVPKTWLGSDTNAVIPVVVMSDVPFNDAVKALAGQLHLKISADEFSRDAEGQPIDISLRWENLTAKQALVALLDNYNLILIMDAKNSTARIIRNNKAAQTTAP